MGYSWGGAEALLAAARRPEAMRSLIMVEPALDLLAQDDPTLATDPAVRDANTRRFLNWMASQTPAEYGEAFRRSAAQRPRRRRIRRRRPRAATEFGCSFLRARMAPVPAFREAVAAVMKARIPSWSSAAAGAPPSRRPTTPRPGFWARAVSWSSRPTTTCSLSSPEDLNRVVNDFMRTADHDARAKPD